MIYVFWGDLFRKEVIGVRKKVIAQCKVFARNFEHVYYTSYSGQMVYLLSGEKILQKKPAVTKQEFYGWVLKWIHQYGIQKAYVRYSLSDKYFIDFLRELKKKPIVFVLEFPTIPYDGELSNKRIILEDGYYREQLSEYVEQCTTYSKMDSVFGIPCIPLMNGVDMEEQSLRKCREKDGRIVLLAVAYMAGWHGYERVIEGMAHYYRMGGEKNILFKLVGTGPEIEKYKSLAEKHGLGHRIEFCGELEGKELDRQYDESDIAVGSLGLYKKKLEQAAPIKLREYCSRGIPFIYGYRDTGFQGDEEYLLNLPNKNEEVSMESVIALYERTAGNTGIISKMREIAMQNFTWDNILKPIISFYNM